MGASMSSSFLYKIIAPVEIVCSAVIAVFGVNTFLLFHEMDESFQTEKEMIQYSSIVAVVQSVLTLMATVFLIGCHYSSLRQETQSAQEAKSSPTSPKKRRSHTHIGHQYSLRRKAIVPTWIAWTLISIASLLFVFIGPIHYCIQAESDLQKLRTLPFHDGFYETIDNKRLGLCYSEAPQLAPMRNSLKDLYSFSIIGLLFKALFVIMIHRNWRREMSTGKKAIVYGEGPEPSAYNDEDELEVGVSSPNTDNPKVVVSSCGPTGSGLAEQDSECKGEGEDGKNGNDEPIPKKN